MPFATEEAWRYIPHEGEALIIADWPQADTELISDEIEARMRLYLDIVREIRNTRGDFKVDPGKRIGAIARENDIASELARNDYILGRLCNVDTLMLIPADAPEPANSANIVVGELSLFLPLEGMIDIAAERQRLASEKAKIEEQLVRTEKMLANKNFVERARPDVVQRERTRLDDLTSALSQIDQRIASVRG